MGKYWVPRIAAVFCITAPAIQVCAAAKWQRVARDNCGLHGAEQHLLSGQSYTYTERDIPATVVALNSIARTVAFGECLAFEFHGLVSGANYEIRLTFLSDSDTRSQRVTADGVALIDALRLPDRAVIERRLRIPPAITKDGVLTLEMSRITGPNAVVSVVELWSDDPTLASPRPFPSVEVPCLTVLPTTIERVRGPRLTLNGTWLFHPSPRQGFFRTSEIEDWQEFAVPGEWVMQGFTVEPGSAAGFQRRFTIPADWEGLRLKLRFDGVWSDCRVWCNGHEVGGHLGGFTPFEVDITDAACIGDNSLALSVKSESVTDVLASASQYAVHPLGGIPRKVELFALPKLHLEDMVVTTSFDEHYQDAMLIVTLRVVNEGNMDVNDATISLELRDPQGRAVTLETSDIRVPCVIPEARVTQEIRLPIERPMKWDTEHPLMYELSCTLQAPGQATVIVDRRIGFRQVETRGERVLVNGQPIKLRGVNRHEVHPLRGRSLTPPLWRKDAELFRAANVNYIRTSHYPPAEEFLDACDELGLFVECEAPLCWVQHGANPNWSEQAWKERYPSLFPHLARANFENVMANRHHPSIIIWSLANESRWSRLFARILVLIEEMDPTRLTAHHDQCWGDYNNAGSTAMVANMHYPGLGWARHVAEEPRPVLFGEYCHLNTYNRREIATDPGLRDAWGLALANMWELMYADDGCLGGAIWSGIDDTFFPPGGHTIGYGAWGPIDGWRRPKPEYWHLKKIYSPIRVLTKRLPASGSDHAVRVDIENRYDFTNLGEVRIDWAVGKQSGRVHADVPPHTRGALSLPPALTLVEGDLLELTFTDPRDFICDHVRIPIGEQPGASRQPPPTPFATTTVEETPDALIVRGDNFLYRIDHKRGVIVKCMHDGSVVLLGGPTLMILPLNSDGGTQMTSEAVVYEPFTATCDGWTVESIERRGSGRVVSIEISGSYHQAKGSFTLQFKPCGELVVDYRFELLEDINPRQIGLVFDLPGSFDTLTWERNAQWSVYPEDHIGRLKGTAILRPGGTRSGPAGPLTEPSRAWSRDWTEMGGNDFRSTKMNITRASLTSGSGRCIEFESDGSQHVRAWANGKYVSVLIADYSNLGAEPFLGSHARPHEKPLKTGDVICGKVHLRHGKKPQS